MAYEGNQIEAGIARLALEGGHQGFHRRLRGETGHRGNSGVDDIHARLGGEEKRRDLAASGVVRVEVDRDADLLAEDADQIARRKGRQRPAMSLIASRFAPSASSSFARAM